VELVPIDDLFNRAADSRSHTQLSVSGWGADYPTARGYLFNVFDCQAFTPATPANSNFSEFCDPRVEAAMDRALEAQGTDVGASARLWSKVDRLITDAAPTATLTTVRYVVVVSSACRTTRGTRSGGP
jgi:peptide/nickel transport system substrate-binding protein